MEQSKLTPTPPRRSFPRLPIGKPFQHPPLHPTPKLTARAPQKIELLRVARVASMLDVSKKRVYQMIDEGKITAIRLGPRQLRIPKQNLEEYLRRAARDEIARYHGTKHRLNLLMN